MRLAVAISVFVGLLLMGLMVFGDTLDQWLTGPEGLEWLRSLGPWAGVAGMGLIVSDLLLPVPATGVMAGLGQIYGGLVGGLYAAGGSIAAGLVAYGATRLLGPGGARVIAGEANLIRLRHFFQWGGAWAIALTRVLPVFPEVLCCLAGLAPMPFGRFATALICGSVPMSFVFAFFGTTAGEEPVTNILIAVAVPAVIFPPVWLLVLRMTAARRAREGEPPCSVAGDIRESR